MWISPATLAPVRERSEQRIPEHLLFGPAWECGFPSWVCLCVCGLGPVVLLQEGTRLSLPRRSLDAAPGVEPVSSSVFERGVSGETRSLAPTMCAWSLYGHMLSGGYD